MDYVSGQAPEPKRQSGSEVQQRANSRDCTCGNQENAA